MLLVQQNACTDILKNERGFSRSEFIFKEDEPYMLELNTTPGTNRREYITNSRQKLLV